MPRMFGRACSVNVGGIDTSGFSTAFEVTRSLDKTQNTASITIRNLGETTRKALQSVSQGVLCELRAGYVDYRELPVLFLGRTRIVTSVHKGATWETTLETGDGDEYRTALVSKSYPGGISTKSVISDLVKLMKAEGGNLVSALKGASDKPLDGAMTIHEQSDDTLSRLLGSMDLEHSWQNDTLQVIKRGGSLNATAVFLDSETGLIESAELHGKRVTAGKTQEATVRFTALLNAEITPGRIVTIDSVGWSGSCVCKKVSHLGDTQDGAWYTAVEGLLI